MLLYVFYSDDVRDKGFTVILDMRGSTWQIVKPILKVLQVCQGLILSITGMSRSNFKYGMSRSNLPL
jgi:hypothetical protein